MHDLRIEPVASQAQLRAFITFPWKVYQDDPYWVPPLISERLKFLDPAHNPFFEHARVEYFLALRGDLVVGTIAAFTNQGYNEFHQVNVGYFGFFEVLDDQEAAQALLQRACQWARQAGHDSIIGPAQFSTNDELGLLIDGFDDTPRILMTHNPRYYQAFIEQAGFEKAIDLWAYAINAEDFEQQIPEKLLRVVEKVQQRGRYVVRKPDMRRWDEEVAIVKKVYNTSWERNWGFVPFTDAELEKLAHELKQIIDPDLAVVVEKDGEPIGFALCLPDVNQALHKAYPHPRVPEIWTMLKLLWYWKVRGRLKWLRVFALGVLPEYRGKGVDALMYLATAREAAGKGYQMAEMSWILENNVMMNRTAEMLGGRVYRTYRMYEKAL